MDDDTQVTTLLNLYQPYEECSCKPSLQTKDGLESTTQSQIYFLYQLWDLKGMQWQHEKPFLLLQEELINPGEAHSCPQTGWFCSQVAAVQMMQFHMSHMQANLVIWNKKMQCSD